MLCYSVDSKDSLENVESKWVGEIADNCPGVKLVLVALKCDLREGADDDEEGASKPANAQDDLYRMMEQFKAQGGKKAEEGNVTNSLAMLTAIPEVDLGMECVSLKS